MQLVEGVIDSSIAGTPKMTLIAIASKAVIELEAAGLLRVVKEHGQPTHYFIEIGGAK